MLEVLAVIITLLLQTVSCLSISNSNTETIILHHVSGNRIQGHKVPLQRTVPSSPYTFAVSNIQDLPKNDCNFLATQVWPSSRMAAFAIQKYFNTSKRKFDVVCEFGCGPGLPSITAAKIGKCSKVYATDIDIVALQLVHEAARLQNIHHIIETKQFDLINNDIHNNNNIPIADLYVLSDVFECADVAIGAAKITSKILLKDNTSSANIWIFAQSDRSQREIFLLHLQQLLNDYTLHWTTNNDFFNNNNINNIPLLQYNNKLWLCNIDETQVMYN